MKHYLKDSPRGWTIKASRSNALSLNDETLDVKHRLWYAPFALRYASCTRNDCGGVTIRNSEIYYQEVISKDGLGGGEALQSFAVNAAEYLIYKDMEAAVLQWMGDVEKKWEKRGEENHRNIIKARQLKKKNLMRKRQKEQKKRTVSRRGARNGE